MLERIVENWLTNCGEREFETPFAQLLSIEGFRVLHGPVHHPQEHGKDIVAFSPDGFLCAFQLKGGDIDLAQFQRIQQQLLALAGTAVDYPGIEPPRRPDRIYLVTNGELSPPARSRLAAFNAGNRPLRLPVLEAIEKPQLLGRFITANGRFWPSEPEDINALLRFYVNDGLGTFPTREFSGFLLQILGDKSEDLSENTASRSISSAVLMTAYATAAWQRRKNNLGVAQGWLTTCVAILYFAATRDLSENLWVDSYSLALSSAREELNLLLHEAVDAEDLVIPDLVEGSVYGSRALLICGFIAGYFLSEHYLEESAPDDIVARLLMREARYIKILGEYAAPFILHVGSALELLGYPVEGRTLVFRYAESVAKRNQPRSADALPDPYHSLDECLEKTFGPGDGSFGERFDGIAYSLHVVIDWLARRGERDALTRLWPAVTRLSFHEFQTTSPEYVLAAYDREGQLLMWEPAAPESWNLLTSRAMEVRESELPGVLWRHLEILPYLLLLFPYRLTRATERALEYASTNGVEVTLDDPENDG